MLAGRPAMKPRMAGVQHSPFARNYISFFPERAAHEKCQVPDLLFVVGSDFKSWFQAEGMAAHRLRILGALRFEELLANKVKTNLNRRDKNFRILCVLAIEFDESFELAQKVCLAFTDEPDVRLIVNFHPAMHPASQKRIKKMITQKMPLAETSLKTARELYSDTDLVIYNSTGASLEALIVGVPVLFVEREGSLDFDKVPSELRLSARNIRQIRSQAFRIRDGDWTPPDQGFIWQRLSNLLGSVDATVIENTSIEE